MTRTAKAASWRIGIILTVTGIISLVLHGRDHHLGPWAWLVIGVVLLVMGLVLLYFGLRRGLGKGKPPDTSQ